MSGELEAKRSQLLDTLAIIGWTKFVDDVSVAMAVFTDALHDTLHEFAKAAEVMGRKLVELVIDGLAPIDWNQVEFDRRYALQRQRKMRRVRSVR